MGKRLVWVVMTTGAGDYQKPVAACLGHELAKREAAERGEREKALHWVEPVPLLDEKEGAFK